MANPYEEFERTQRQRGQIASRPRRFWGALIDSLVMVPIVFLLMYALGFWEKATAGTLTYFDSILGAAIGFGAMVLVNGHLLATRGQTVGKWMVDTQIVSHSTGQRLDLGTLLAFRYLPVSIVSLIPLLGNLLGIANVALIFRKDRRCAHDHIADTKVIRYVPTDA